MAIRIVTDSSADLPPELAHRWNITVLPCYVIVGGRTYRDGIDILPDEFYRQLAVNPHPPTTAQPSAADFQPVYRDLLDQGHQVVSIHLSSKLSGTLNSAEQARAAIGGDGGQSIEIVDSRLASVSLALVVLAAAKLAQDAGSHRQLADEVRRDLPLTHCIFLLDTLEYLQKGGRIGKARAFLGSVLGVKPILALQDGEVHPIERPRNRQRGLRRLVEMAQGMAPVRQLGVIHSTEPEQAELLRREVSGLLPQDEIVMARFGPTLGTYVGPNAVGIALTSAGDTLKP